MNKDYGRSEFGLKVENGYMIGCPEFTASSSDHHRICVKFSSTRKNVNHCLLY